LRNRLVLTRWFRLGSNRSQQASSGIARTTVPGGSRHLKKDDRPNNGDDTNDKHNDKEGVVSTFGSGGAQLDRPLGNLATLGFAVEHLWWKHGSLTWPRGDSDERWPICIFEKSIHNNHRLPSRTK
jgi:hypothetical protein